MIFGNTVGYDSIYSYPYESRKITVQEMMENIPLYDSEKGKSSNERTENRKKCDITESESKIVKALYSKINSKIDSYIQKIMINMNMRAVLCILMTVLLGKPLHRLLIRLWKK